MFVRIPTFGGVEPRAWHVYVAWSDDQRRPLYVGLSGQVLVRIAQHLTGAPWRDQVRYFDCIPVESATRAAEVEIDLIEALDPIHNVQRSRSSIGQTFDRNRAIRQAAGA